MFRYNLKIFVWTQHGLNKPNMVFAWDPSNMCYKEVVV